MKKYTEILVHLSVWTVLLVILSSIHVHNYSLTIAFALFNGVFVYIHSHWVAAQYQGKDTFHWYLLSLLIITFAISLTETLIGMRFQLFPSNDGLSAFNKLTFLILANVAIKLLLFLPLSFIYTFVRNSIVYRLVELRYLEICLHIFIWGIGWLLIFEKQTQWAIEFYFSNFIITISYVSIFLIMNALLFYGNIFWLIPSFLAKRKTVLYLLILGALLGSILSIEWMTTQVAELWMVQTKNSINDIAGNNFNRNLAVKLLLILPLSFLYRFTKDWIANENIKRQLIGEKLAAELSFLKYQINPHFLFNTLNNLYGLALAENSSQTADGVAKLGTMMRYILQETDVQYIGLAKEIEYIQNFVGLQRIRISQVHPIDIDFNVEGEKEHFLIAPMILIPFVENAFKHGISLRTASFVHIHIQVFGNMLRLLVKNSMHPAKQKPEESGLGLENVKRRLELIYPGRYTLDMHATEEVFSVSLTLDLKKH